MSKNTCVPFALAPFALPLDALRYLISRIDARRMARIRKSAPLTESPPEGPAQPGASPAAPVSPPPMQRKWLSIYNEELWTRLF